MTRLDEPNASEEQVATVIKVFVDLSDILSRKRVTSWAVLVLASDGLLYLKVIGADGNDRCTRGTVEGLPEF